MLIECERQRRGVWRERSGRSSRLTRAGNPPFSPGPGVAAGPTAGLLADAVPDRRCHRLGAGRIDPAAATRSNTVPSRGAILVRPAPSGPASKQSGATAAGRHPIEHFQPRLQHPSDQSRDLPDLLLPTRPSDRFLLSPGQPRPAVSLLLTASGVHRISPRPPLLPPLAPTIVSSRLLSPALLLARTRYPSLRACAWASSSRPRTAAVSGPPASGSAPFRSASLALCVFTLFCIQDLALTVGLLIAFPWDRLTLVACPSCRRLRPPSTRFSLALFYS